MDSMIPNSRRVQLRLVVVVFLALSITDLVLRGWGSEVRVLLLACVTAVALLEGWRSGAVTLAASMLGLLIAVLVENPAAFSSGDLSQPYLGTRLLGFGAFLVSGVLIVCISRILSNQAGERLDQVRRETRSLARSVLDARIAALQTSNQSLQRRARYLEASLSVAQLLSTVFDVGPLLNRAAELISEQFGFTDVLVYLVDDAEEWSTLQAASTVAGKEMVLRGVRLRRGSGGPIGWVTARKQPQVLSQGEREKMESGYLADPDPAGTRSSVTLPLMVGQQLIGILDIRSSMGKRSAAEELSALEGLATHLALAINNARRLGDDAAILESTSPIYRTAHKLATAWTEREVYDVFLSALRPYGPARTLIVRTTGTTDRDLHLVVEMQGSDVDYSPRDLAQLTSSSLIDVVILGLTLDNPLWIWNLSDLDESLNPELSSALAGLAEGKAAHAAAFIPIHLEGATAKGGLVLLYGTMHRFTPVERRLHQLLTELGGAALDRSELLTEARAHLEREEVLLSVGERLRSSLDPDVILQRAVQELGGVLDAELTTIEIVPESDPQSTDNPRLSTQIARGDDGSADAHPPEDGDTEGDEVSGLS